MTDSQLGSGVCLPSWALKRENKLSCSPLAGPPRVLVNWRVISDVCLQASERIGDPTKPDQPLGQAPNPDPGHPGKIHRTGPCALDGFPTAMPEKASAI